VASCFRFRVRRFVVLLFRRFVVPSFYNLFVYAVVFPFGASVFCRFVVPSIVVLSLKVLQEFWSTTHSVKLSTTTQRSTEQRNDKTPKRRTGKRQHIQTNYKRTARRNDETTKQRNDERENENTTPPFSKTFLRPGGMRACALNNEIVL
jgi:hypothetical protein